MPRISLARPHEVYPFVLLFFFFASLLATVVDAQVVVTGQPANPITTLLAQDDHLAIDLGVGYVEFPSNHILNNDTVEPGTFWEPVVLPQHGLLWKLKGGFHYEPDRSFWDLGLDSFMYSLVAPNGEISIATVYFYPKSQLELVYEEKFEDNAYLENFFTSGPASLGESSSSSPAIVGTGTMAISVTGHGEAYLAIPSNSGDPGPTTGSNSDSGRTSGMIDDSDNRGGHENAKIVLIKLGKESFGPLDTSVQLVYTWNGTQRLVAAEVWDENLGAFVATPPVALVSVTPEVEMTWYRTGDMVGVWVEADGRVEGPVEGFNSVAEFDHSRVGVMPEEPVVEADFRFDDIRIWRAVGRNAFLAPPIQLSNNFENLQFGSQSFTVGSGIAITPEAAITGEQGLEIDLLAGDSYLRTTWADLQDELNLRFRADISALSMEDDEMFTFLASGVDSNFADLSLRLYLGKRDGVMHFAGHIYRDGGQPITLSWTPVPSSFEVLLRLRVSSSEWIGNGYLQLWIDDVPYEIFHVPNTTRILGWSQFGAHGVDPLTSGFLYLDDLTVWD